MIPDLIHLTETIKISISFRKINNFLSGRKITQYIVRYQKRKFKKWKPNKQENIYLFRRIITSFTSAIVESVETFSVERWNWKKKKEKKERLKLLDIYLMTRSIKISH